MEESRRKFINKASEVITGTAILGILNACSPENFQEHLEYVSESSNGAEAHKSGDEFAKRVGDTLKQQYPSMVENPSVRIEVVEESGVTKFKFTWRCNFIKCQEKDADYYFDRRGTLLFGETSQVAHNNVEAELKESGKVQQMMNAFDLKYGSHRMPNSFVSESLSQLVVGKVWCIREFFCTAKK